MKSILIFRRSSLFRLFFLTALYIGVLLPSVTSNAFASDLLEVFENTLQKGYNYESRSELKMITNAFGLEQLTLDYSTTAKGSVNRDFNSSNNGSASLHLKHESARRLPLNLSDFSNFKVETQYDSRFYDSEDQWFIQLKDLNAETDAQQLKVLAFGLEALRQLVDEEFLQLSLGEWVSFAISKELQSGSSFFELILHHRSEENQQALSKLVDTLIDTEFFQVTINNSTFARANRVQSSIGRPRLFILGVKNNLPQGESLETIRTSFLDYLQNNDSLTAQKLYREIQQLGDIQWANTLEQFRSHLSSARFELEIDVFDRLTRHVTLRLNDVSGKLTGSALQLDYTMSFDYPSLSSIPKPDKDLRLNMNHLVEGLILSEQLGLMSSLNDVVPYFKAISPDDKDFVLQVFEPVDNSQETSQTEDGTPAPLPKASVKIETRQRTTSPNSTGVSPEFDPANRLVFGFDLDKRLAIIRTEDRITAVGDSTTIVEDILKNINAFESACFGDANCIRRKSNSARKQLRLLQKQKVLNSTEFRTLMKLISDLLEDYR